MRSRTDAPISSALLACVCGGAPLNANVESECEIVRVKNKASGDWEERWTGDCIFENEWRYFRTKKDRSLELTSVFHEGARGRRKLAVKVVDIFSNDTMTIVEVRV